MVEEAEKSLWEQFHLDDESNSDPGRTLIYLLIHERVEVVQEARAGVIDALQELSVQLVELDNRINARINPDASVHEMTDKLVDLHSLNSAETMLESGVATLEACLNGLRTRYYELLKDRKKVEAYEIVSVSIPQLVEDLRKSDSRFEVLTVQHKRALEEIMTFTRSAERGLNKGGVLIFS